MTPPRLVYDDDCGFCMYCVRWLLRFGEFEPVGFGDLTPDQRARLPDHYENCLHLLTDDAVYSCGAAAEQSLARCGVAGRSLARLARQIPYWGRLRERGYRFVADRRAVWGRFRSCSAVE
jgi:predicted DCC family thiol-disulfide oxidoreductase YuxK